MSGEIPWHIYARVPQFRTHKWMTDSLCNGARWLCDCARVRHLANSIALYLHTSHCLYFHSCFPPLSIYRFVRSFRLLANEPTTIRHNNNKICGSLRALFNLLEYFDLCICTVRWIRYDMMRVSCERVSVRERWALRFYLLFFFSRFSSASTKFTSLSLPGVMQQGKNASSKYGEERER